MPLRQRVVASCGLFSATIWSKAMSTNLEALEAEALKLAPSDRSHLLERLIASLDSDPQLEAAWGLEADRREAELVSGVTVEVSGADALARLRSKLAQ